MLVIVFLLVQGIRAQHPLYYSLNDENGLPNNEVYEIAQDSFGLVWLGTASGIYSYDGLRFTVYENSQRKGSTITAVYADARKRIWCRNNSSQVFRIERDSLMMIFDGSAEDSLQLVAFSPDGSLFLILTDGIVHLREDGSEQARWNLRSQWGGRFPCMDAAVKDGKLYLLATLKGLFVFDPVQGQLDHIAPIGADETGGFNFKGPGLFLACQDQKTSAIRLGEISDRQLHYFWQSPPIGNPRMLRIVPVSPARFYLCTQNGVQVFRKEGDTWRNAISWLPLARASSVMQDAEGITWFATLNAGIHVMVSEDLRMHLPAGADAVSMGTTAITVLPGNRLIAGNSSGSIYQVDPVSGTFTGILNEPGDEQKISVKVLRCSGGSLLISRGRVSVADPMHLEEVPLPLHNARDLYLKGDSLFVVLNSAARLYSMQELRAGRDQYRTLLAAGARVVAEDSISHVVYIGGASGLFRFRGGRMDEIRYEGKSVFCHLLIPTPGGLWAFCNGIGILVIRDGEVVNRPGNEMGLADAKFGCATLQGDWLFFATQTALCRLQLSTGEVTQLTRAVGIKPDNFVRLVAMDSSLWAASPQGLLQMPLFFEPMTGDPPAIRISGVEVNNVHQDADGALSLPSRHSNVRITFQGISFRSRGGYSFKCRLRGYDPVWTSIPGSSNYIIYPALPHGDFVFEVKAVDINGRESTLPATLNIHVDTPWLLRPGAIAGIITLAFLLALSIFLLILRVIRRRHLAKQQYIASQLTALKAQMNPHFMFNALNSIQELVLSKDIRNSNLYLGKFSTLMRKVLDGSGKNEVLLSDEIEMLRLYLDLEVLRFGAEMEYVFEVDPALDPAALYIPSMVIQPFVENAIKHGLLHKKGRKLLTLQFTGGDGLTCTITDNGVGRRRSAEIRERGRVDHKSFSTEATGKRLHLIRNLYGSAVGLTTTDLEQDGEALGTRVEIRLPFMKP